MDLKSKKVAVTGAGGFIGRNLLGSLEERGAKIIGFDLPGVTPVAGKHTTWVASDLSNESEVRAHLADAEVVFHLAFPVSDWESEDKFIAALKLSDLICRIAEEEAQRLILTTSVVVYGDKIGKGPIDEATPYGKANGFYTEYKQKQEQNAIGHFHRAKLDVRIVRPANVYGAGSKPWVVEVIKVLRQGLPALIGDGKGRAGLIHVTNLVDILLRVAEDENSRGEIYLASDDNHVAWHTYFSDLAHIARTDPPSSIPRFASDILAIAGETAWKTFGIKGRPPLTRQALMLVGADNDFSNKKVREKLGFKPIVSYQQALHEIENYVQTLGI